MAVGLLFAPPMVGLFGLIGCVGPVGMAPGVVPVTPGLLGLIVPGVPGSPADGVVPVPLGAVVAPLEGAAVPGDAQPAAVLAESGRTAMESKQRKLVIVFISKSRPEFC